MTTQQRYIVGRGENVDIFINDITVSGSHLSLMVLDDYRVRIIDNNSTNGTYLVKTGNLKIMDEVVDMDCTLLLGATYTTTPRLLLQRLAPQVEAQSKPRTAPNTTEPFSRYLRDDNGEFKRK